MKIIKYFFILLPLLAICLCSCSSLKSNLKKLRSPHSEARCEAIYWLHQNVQNKANKKLIIDALTKDESEVVRSLAARLMGIEKNPLYLPLLTSALSDPSALVRMEAVQSIGSINRKASLPDIASLLKKEPEVLVRLKALKSINYMGSKQAIPALIDELEDQEPAARFQALILLEKFTKANPGMDKNSWKEWYQKHKSIMSRTNT